MMLDEWMCVRMVDGGWVENGWRMCAVNDRGRRIKDVWMDGWHVG
jgi:hypothetical protein